MRQRGNQLSVVVEGLGVWLEGRGSEVGFGCQGRREGWEVMGRDWMGVDGDCLLAVKVWAVEAGLIRLLPKVC